MYQGNKIPDCILSHLLGKAWTTKSSVKIVIAANSLRGGVDLFAFFISYRAEIIIMVYQLVFFKIYLHTKLCISEHALKFRIHQMLPLVTLLHQDIIPVWMSYSINVIHLSKWVFQKAF